MSDYLFVYGTLRRRSGHPMAKYLAQRARFVSVATVVGLLYDLGRFPGMVEAPLTPSHVVGDVYQLGATEETLAELDRYENIESPLPSYFERGLAEAVLSDGRKMQVMVYWYRGAVDEKLRVTSGNYEDILRNVGEPQASAPGVKDTNTGR
jgi:gamma-glutamylcyclotransferase (GGCT)/AIG2-like uncharacterized protein YtfP